MKMIALITMLIDHTASVLLRQIEAADVPFVQVGKYALTLYTLCRLIGRFAFPIYAFLITEGYKYTHDRKKYGISLFVFALISEIPWNLEHTGDLFWSRQNVFFTLFTGYLGICCYEHWKK